MDKTIGQATISVDQEGYLTDFSQWTKEVGEEIAKEQGIEMTDKHWEIIDYIQEKYKNEEPLSIRGIKKSGVINFSSGVSGQYIVEFQNQKAVFNYRYRFN